MGQRAERRRARRWTPSTPVGMSADFPLLLEHRPADWAPSAIRTGVTGLFKRLAPVGMDDWHRDASNPCTGTCPWGTAESRGGYPNGRVGPRAGALRLQADHDSLQSGTGAVTPAGPLTEAYKRGKFIVGALPATLHLPRPTSVSDRDSHQRGSSRVNASLVPLQSRAVARRHPSTLAFPRNS